MPRKPISRATAKSMLNKDLAHVKQLQRDVDRVAQNLAHYVKWHRENLGSVSVLQMLLHGEQKVGNQK